MLKKFEEHLQLPLCCLSKGLYRSKNNQTLCQPLSLPFRSRNRIDGQHQPTSVKSTTSVRELQTSHPQPPYGRRKWSPERNGKWQGRILQEAIWFRQSQTHFPSRCIPFKWWGSVKRTGWGVMQMTTHFNSKLKNVWWYNDFKRSIENTQTGTSRQQEPGFTV